MRSFYLALSLTLAATAPRAEVPAVVTDILPVHSIVSAVLGDLGSPHLLIRPGEDPHHGGLRPSDANALSKADLVVWIGPELTPWLSKGLETLAGSSRSIELMEHPDTHRLPARENGHSDGEHDGHDDHAEHANHDDHKDHADHDAHEEHDDHKDHEEHAEHDAHDHGEFDPHVWLDPDNAILWLTVLADALSEIDPDNAQTYRANAEQEANSIAELVGAEKAAFSSLHSNAFLTTHDSYQYFEVSFGLSMRGAVSDSDNKKPGPARLAQIMELAQTAETRCLAHDLVTPKALIATLQSDTDLLPVEIDPLGSENPIGPEYYRDLLKDMSVAFQKCLGEGHG